MVLGLALAVLTAIATNLAFLFKHRGAVAAPTVDARHLLRSAAGLFRTPAWTIGFTIAVGAWALHVAALALEVVGRIAAFCLVIFGAGLMPGPVRAGETAATRRAS